MNYTVSLNKFKEASPVECYKLHIIGVYCSILLLLSLIYNSSLILVFMKHRELRTTLNMFVLTMTILNLIGSILEFSFVIPSNFACRWVFPEMGCGVSGFIMYFVGCSGIYLMTAISIERQVHENHIF